MFFILIPSDVDILSLDSNKRTNKTAIKSNAKIFPIYNLKQQVSEQTYTINKNGLQTNMRKVDGIAFGGGAHIQQGSRRLILNLT